MRTAKQPTFIGSETSKKTLQDGLDVIGEEGAKPMKVMDQAAFDEYNRLNKHPMLNERSKHTASDGSIINLMKVTPHVKKDIEHLPLPEQAKIMALKTVQVKIQNKRTGQYKKAFGVVNKDGTTYNDRLTSTLDHKRAELIELFGKMFNIAEVHEIVLKIWKLQIKKDTLNEWRQKNQEAINIRIEQHKREYSDVRLAYKRSRLEELTWMYNKRKRIYEISVKGDDHRLLLSTLAQIKQEVEGDLIRIDGSLTMDIEAAIGGKMKDTFSNISLKEIIVARVAAKSNLDVAKVVQGISRGYYFKQLHAEDIDHELVATFPSTQTYDFDRIQRIQAQKQANEAIETQGAASNAQAVQLQTKQASDSIKALLLRKLQARQGDINHTENSLGGKFIEAANK